MVGISSNMLTNQDQGGGPAKCAPPSTVGVPTGVIRVYPKITCANMVDRMTTLICRTQSVASNSSDSSAMTITFLTNSLSFSPQIGMAISSGSFIAIITNVFVDSAQITAEVTYTLISGTPPSTNIATYTIKPAGC